MICDLRFKFNEFFNDFLYFSAYHFSIMNLRISVKKQTQKPCILTITRSDSSSTWAKLHLGMETHDLAHYAVEKSLGFKHAFYGIIDQGYQISDFELPKAQRPDAVKPENLHSEALITEHLVNLLEVELLNSGLNTNLINDLQHILTNANLPFPQSLDEETLNTIRQLYHSLYNQWIALEENNTLNLRLDFNH